MQKKRVVISVTNDLVTDQRVHKIAQCLHQNNYDVFVYGRFLPHSKPLNRPYKTHCFRLPFHKGPLFYATYNARLFFQLLCTKADVFYANDLDTLPANYIASIIRRKEVIYDSHEYFTEVPELVNRKRVQSIWKKIERGIVPKLKHCITVSASIAEIYTRKYGVPFELVRNMPVVKEMNDASNAQQLRAKLNIPDDHKVVLYQGAINIGRGIELMIEALQHLPKITFLVMGDGDIRKEVEQAAIEFKVSHKVIFTGRVPFEALQPYTKLGNLGISLEEDMGLNYRYALPNKIFDYIHCGIPTLVSNLPEMSRLVHQYTIGKVFEGERTAKNLASVITEMFANSEAMQQWSINCREAQKHLNWESESKKLLKIVHSTCFSPHIPRHR